MNTGNSSRRTIGIVTRVIDDEMCEVFWSSDYFGQVSGWTGRIRRDGVPNYYHDIPNHGEDRVVRVKLSVRIAQEV